MAETEVKWITDEGVIIDDRTNLQDLPESVQKQVDTVIVLAVDRMHSNVDVGTDGECCWLCL